MPSPTPHRSGLPAHEQVPAVFFYQLVHKDLTLLAALHLKLLTKEARLTAILAHPRARAAFAAFLLKVEGDQHALECYESMHSYAHIHSSKTALAAAARVVGESILSDFILEHCSRPVPLSQATRQRLYARLPRALGEAWPADLFVDAEAELDALLRKQYMPRFMDHPVFERVLATLGSYEVERLFPSERLEAAAQDLIVALDGDLSVTCLRKFDELSFAHRKAPHEDDGLEPVTL